MPELKKVEIETTETPQPTPQPSDSQLAMAVTYGQMVETNKQLMDKIAQSESDRSQTNTLLQALVTDVQAMKSRQDSTIQQVETLDQSLTDTILTQGMENSKSEESDVLEITPMVEAKVKQVTEIETKPITANRSLIHKLIFGNR